MHVAHPNYGALFAGTRVDDAGAIDSDTLIHPLVEPEIALVLRDDVVEPPSSRERLIALIDAIVPALEVVDTRYERYACGAVDNIADNSSAARFVIGAARSPANVGDLRTVPAVLHANGTVVARGVGADAMGDPYDALAWFLARASRDGLVVRGGSIILTGGLTAAQPAAAGSAFLGGFGALGSVRCSFSDLLAC
jgi:2-keto-4-pentenoate hydratase